MKFLPPDVSNLHTMRKAANGLAKGHLSHAKRPSFARQLAVFYNLLKTNPLRKRYAGMKEKPSKRPVWTALTHR